MRGMPSFGQPDSQDAASSEFVTTMPPPVAASSPESERQADPDDSYKAIDPEGNVVEPPVEPMSAPVASASQTAEESRLTLVRRLTRLEEGRQQSTAVAAEQGRLINAIIDALDEVRREMEMDPIDWASIARAAEEGS